MTRMPVKPLGKGQLRDIVGVGSAINAEGHEGPTKRPTETRFGDYLDNLTIQQMQSGTSVSESPMKNPTFGQPKSKKNPTPISEGEKKA